MSDSKIKTGVAGFIDAAGRAFQQLADALRGYTIRSSPFVARGNVVVLPGDATPNGLPAHVYHPLDAISIEFADDPFTELEEIAAYFADRAERELDALLVAIDSTIKNAEARQDLRMREWCRKNGYSVDAYGHIRPGATS